MPGDHNHYLGFRASFKRSRVVLMVWAGLVCLPALLTASRLVTDETGRRVNIPDHPRRLVSLAPNITETLYALGLGDRLVGDTDFCDYPPEARQKPHVGLLLNPSLEKIVTLKPDLVLGDAESNRRETADQLERLGIPLYGLTAHSVEDALRSIEDLGRVLGRESVAEALVAGLRKRVETVEKRVAGKSRPKVLFVVWYRPLIAAGRSVCQGVSEQVLRSELLSRVFGTSVLVDRNLASGRPRVTWVAP